MLCSSLIMIVRSVFLVMPSIKALFWHRQLLANPGRLE